MKDGSVIRHVTLKELNLGDLNHVLHVEVLVQGPDPGPVPPRPRLLAPLTVGLCRVDTVVLSRPEAQQDTQLLPRPGDLPAGHHSLHDGEGPLPQTPAPSLPRLLTV